MAEALVSIQAQTHRDFDVIISIDGSDPESEAVCSRFLDDSRFRLVVQPKHLGWMGNVNWLMAQAKGDFWYFHGHDDLVDETYVEVLLDHACRHPEAAVVYSDMRTFGARDERFVQPSIVGQPIFRQLAMLLGPFAPVAFRGLVQCEILRRVGSMHANEADDFLADTVWLAAALKTGPLHRIPLELYRKRYHDRNEHRKWWQYSPDQRIFAWSIHCRDMLRTALTIKASHRERKLIWAAGVDRLLTGRLGYAQVENLDPTRQATVLADFIALMRKTPDGDVCRLLAMDWPEIERWTFDFQGLRQPRESAHGIRRLMSRFSQ